LRIELSVENFLLRMSNGPLLKLVDELNAHLVPLLRTISAQEREYVLTNQLLRSSTSIGANACEASMCESRRDFISRLSISRKECKESLYWLKNLQVARLIKDEDYAKAEDILVQLFKILNKSISTSRSRLNV